MFEKTMVRGLLAAASRMKTISLALLLMVSGSAIVTVPSSVRADFSGPFATSTPIPLTEGSLSDPLTFPQFNSSLGTLTSVSMSLTVTMSEQFSATTVELNPIPGFASASIQVGYADPRSDTYRWRAFLPRNLISQSRTRASTNRLGIPKVAQRISIQHQRLP